MTGNEIQDAVLLKDGWNKSKTNEKWNSSPMFRARTTERWIFLKTAEIGQKRLKMDF